MAGPHRPPPVLAGIGASMVRLGRHSARKPGSLAWKLGSQHPPCHPLNGAAEPSANRAIPRRRRDTPLTTSSASRLRQAVAASHQLPGSFRGPPRYTGGSPPTGGSGWPRCWGSGLLPGLRGWRDIPWPAVEVISHPVAPKDQPLIGTWPSRLTCFPCEENCKGSFALSHWPYA